MRLLESTGVPLAGAHAVVLGRSDIVGTPVVAMLRRQDATVTQCHSKSKDVDQIVQCNVLSDPSDNLLIIIVGFYRSKLQTSSWLLSGRPNSSKGNG